MHRLDARRRALGYGIAGLAGFVDATGFLASASYFVSFMSGNTTRLGVDLTNGLARAAVPAMLLAGFVAGVVAGALVGRRFAQRPKSAVILLSVSLLVLAAVARSIGSEGGFLTASVLAMGAINNAFRHHGESGVGLTYMTGALVRLGQGLADALAGDAKPGWAINLVLWASLATGAAVGGAAALRAPGLAAWIAVGLALVLLVFARWIESAGRSSD